MKIVSPFALSRVSTERFSPESQIKCKIGLFKFLRRAIIEAIILIRNSMGTLKWLIRQRS